MLKKSEWLIVGPAVYLSVLSLLVLKSIELTAKTELSFSFARQSLVVVLALVIMLLIIKSKDLLLKGGFIVYLASIALLALVLVYGQSTGGATRWLTFGNWQFQPSELAKLALILVQTKLLMGRRHDLNKPWPLILSTIYALPIIGLIAVEPDLGTAIICGLIWLAILVMSNLPKRTFALLLGLVLLVLPASYPFLADYQRDRIDTFLNPSLATQGEGYNALQATIAVGSGGLTGRGLDSGTQSQLNFLPSQETDFIFAVTSEKLGFLGAFSVIAAFVAMLIGLVQLAWRSSSPAVRLLGTGVIAMIGSQFLINVGMNVGLAPITGIPLPLVSAGGTHVLIELALIGTLISLSRVDSQHLYRS